MASQVHVPGSIAVADNGRAVVPLDDEAATMVDLVGSKAASLAHARAAGFEVPDGFVVPASADLSVPGVAAEVIAAGGLLGSLLAVRSSALAEDRPDASFAGQYETVLRIEPGTALMDAIETVRASGHAERAHAYSQGRDLDPDTRLPVLVQRMVSARAAGVAFTADPVTGDRGTIVVSAVAGLGDRLVAGEVTPDEWRVQGGVAAERHRAEGAITVAEANEVAELARRAEDFFGGPQDIEWAIDEAGIHLLQARAMTALPDQVTWDPGHAGTWLRNFRLGEWLLGPVSPLFETWLLTGIEDRLHGHYARWIGYAPPTPAHVVVNGWYFYGFNVIPTNPLKMVWLLLRHMLPSLLIRPRRAAMVFPPLAKFGIALAHRDWREDVQPRYRRLVADAQEALAAAHGEDIVRLVDGLIDAAGDYFTTITLVGGYAAKAEFALATFHRKELVPMVGGSVLELLEGVTDRPAQLAAHAVHGLDWIDPPLGEAAAGLVADDPARRAAARDRRLAAEARARQALSAFPKSLARFERLLDDAQRHGRLREEQAAEFTLAWPIMREAVLKLGAELVQRGLLDRADQLFDLERRELVAALLGPPSGPASGLGIRADERRADRVAQRRLTPPLLLGKLHPIMDRLVRSIGQALRGDPPDGDGIVGLPASAGVARGPARIVRTREDFDRVRPGDVLISPITTPAWTPLFSIVSAVVTDNGGIGAHASIVAREFGLPAVVGTGDATTRLRDGEPVEVDGSTGTVRRIAAAGHGANR